MYKILNESIHLPLIGLGTWALKGDECIRTVKEAFEIGYRHFDSAHMYDNHEAIGKALRGVDRKQIFLTSKFTLPGLEHECLETACDRALKELGTDYLDLYLIHYPIRSFDMAGVLNEMLKLIEKQKVRALGVSNFTARHLQDMMNLGFQIAVNQVEFHPYLNQKELLTFCRQNQILLTSYRSLGKGALTHDPFFEKIGRKYNKTPAQISLRWLIEQEIAVIPKAVSSLHLKENFNIFDFSLDAQDHQVLGHLHPQHRFCEREWSDFNYV